VLAVPSILFLGATRYRSPADPFLVMLAALGGLAIARRLRASGASTIPAVGKLHRGLPGA
jgi:hypothetical protein